MANERVKVHIWQSTKDGEFYFRFVGRNGKKLNLQGYKRKRSCVETVKLLQEHLPNAPIIFDKPNTLEAEIASWPFKQ
jgi:uncharacterized protein YegP (UPF0339 family)